MRRLTREQRGDDVSKRAFDNFIGSPRNLSGSKPSLQEQTAHGEKWTLTPGCKGFNWARRGYHHTKACKARKREFLLIKARSEELRAAEADAWRKPASSTEPPSSARPSGSARKEGVQPEPVDEQPQPQPDVGDSDMAVSTETPDAEATYLDQEVRPCSADRGCAQEDADLEQALASVDASSRVRTAGATRKLNAVALDLHEPDPETMWSSDLGGGYPSQSCMRPVEKDVKKLQQFRNVRRSPTS